MSANLQLNVIVCDSESEARKVTAVLTRLHVEESDEASSKLLILVPQKSDTTDLQKMLQADRKLTQALHGNVIVIANSDNKADVDTWCIDPKHVILIGTPVVGSGVNNVRCGNVIGYATVRSVDSLLQGAHRSARDHGISRHTLVYVQQTTDRLGGKEGSQMRKTLEEYLGMATGCSSPRDIETIKNTCTFTGVDKYANNVTICRRQFAASLYVNIYMSVFT